MTGKQLKAKRLKLRLTQRAVARRCRMARSALANLENGHRTLTPAHIALITKALTR